MTRKDFGNWQKGSWTEPHEVQKGSESTVQKRIVNRIVEPLIPLLSAGTNPSRPCNRWAPDQGMQRLNQDDMQLVQEKWMANRKDDLEFAKLLSARIAEKLALEFYGSLGLAVCDISIHQLTEVSDDWKRFDLFVSGRRPVDVKNARTMLNGKGIRRFMDHCVKRFKQHNSAAVSILGVSSPWMSLEMLEDQANWLVKPIDYVLLGETTLQELKALEDLFSRSIIKVSSLNDTYSGIPPWAFDYPSEVYQARNGAISDIVTRLPADIPSLRDWQDAGINPVPAFLVADIPLPAR